MEAAKLACASFLLLALCARGWTADNGLAAHYTFDEGRGDMLRDHSGHGNHGKIFGAQWTALEKGYALAFDGEDDHVDCGNDKSLDVAREGTIEVWYKPAAYKGGLLSRHTDNSWPGARLVLAFPSYRRSRTLLWIFADGNFYLRGSWVPPELNAWHHVALSFDGVTIRQYCDGVLLSEGSQSYMIPDFADQPLRLGICLGLGEKYYAGLIDEVKIYNRAVSPAEVFHSFAREALSKAKPIPAGTKRLKVRMRSLLEEGKIILTADVGELRHIRKGMALEVDVRGTDMKKKIPLDPLLWKYAVTLDAGKLSPGDYEATAKVTDQGGRVVGAPEKVKFTWHSLSRRLNRRSATDEALDEADALYLVRNGRPRATIVIPAKPDKWTQKAAEWLAQYVKESTGAVLKVQKENASLKGALISVGHTELLKRAGLTTDGLKYDGCRLVVRGNAVFLFGTDELQFDYQGAKGTCKAVVTFLEDYVGVRWFLPGPEGASVPERRQVAVSKKLDRRVNPAFGYSHGRYAYGRGTPASFANHFRTAIKARSYGGHSYYGWLPEKKYFKDHPEYFALIGGKRTGRGNHLCSSNPDVARILLREIRKEFDRGYDWVQLAQEDGYARCECEACERLDNYRGMASRETPCERLLLLHKWVADQCKKSHPDKTVHLIAYGPTIWPSQKFDKWGDHVVAEMCSQSPEVIEAWKDKVRAMTGYVYWFDITVGPGMGIHATSAKIAEKIRYLHEQKFVGLYQIPETNWGLCGPCFYTLAKLMGDPYLDHRMLQKEYCLGVFGKEAGEAMDEFFNVLYAMPRVHARVWLEKSIRQLDGLLRKAESQARLDRQKEWLKLTRDHFDYSQLLSRMLVAYTTYKAGPTDEKWAAVNNRVDQFDAYRARILRYPDDQTKRFFPGYDHFGRFLAGKYVGYRSSWRANREEVLKKGVRGTRIGWRASGVAVPLTLDFTKPPHQAKNE